MSEFQHIRQNKIKQARLEITAELYKRGYSYSKIATEAQRRLNLPKVPSKKTVFDDIQQLLIEWRSSRIEDMDFALQLELERIDDTVRELWSQWEKSKTDYSKTSSTSKGQPRKEKDDATERLKTFQVEKTVTEVIRLGDVSYIAEIRQQLAERRKLLGLYAPERKELTGKDGKDLLPVETVDLKDFTPEEIDVLLKIARKSD